MHHITNRIADDNGEDYRLAPRREECGDGVRRGYAGDFRPWDNVGAEGEEALPEVKSRISSAPSALTTALSIAVCRHTSSSFLDFFRTRRGGNIVQGNAVGADNGFYESPPDFESAGVTPKFAPNKVTIARELTKFTRK